MRFALVFGHQKHIWLFSIYILAHWQYTLQDSSIGDVPMAMSTDEVHKDARKKAEPVTEKFNGAAKGQGSKAAVAGKAPPQETVGVNAVKKDRLKTSLEYNGPGGAGQRTEAKYGELAADRANYNKSRADKYVKADQAKGASLGQESAKAKGKGQGIG
jgi:hypothetical protein